MRGVVFGLKPNRLKDGSRVIKRVVLFVSEKKQPTSCTPRIRAFGRHPQVIPPSGGVGDGEDAKTLKVEMVVIGFLHKPCPVCAHLRQEAVMGHSGTVGFQKEMPLLAAKFYGKKSVRD